MPDQTIMYLRELNPVKQKYISNVETDSVESNIELLPNHEIERALILDRDAHVIKTLCTFNMLLNLFIAIFFNYLTVIFILTNMLGYYGASRYEKNAILAHAIFECINIILLIIYLYDNIDQIEPIASNTTHHVINDANFFKNIIIPFVCSVIQMCIFNASVNFHKKLKQLE